MASAVVMMVAGAVLNATAFTGSMYLAKTLDKKHSDVEKIRHDKALEKYQQDMGEWRKKREQYQDWLTARYLDKKKADGNLLDTDYAFALYSKTHPDFTLENEPQFANYYKPTQKQKSNEMAYVGVGMLGTGFLAARYL